MARIYKPLKGHPYHSLSDDSLNYIIKDAGEAAECMKGFDYKAEGKYEDQVHDAHTVLRYRRNVESNRKTIPQFRTRCCDRCLKEVPTGARQWWTIVPPVFEINLGISKVENVCNDCYEEAGVKQ